MILHTKNGQTINAVLLRYIGHNVVLFAQDRIVIAYLYSNGEAHEAVSHDILKLYEEYL